MLIPRRESSPSAGIISARSAIRSGGFTLLELLLVIFVGTVLMAVAIPTMRSVMNNMRVNSMVSAISGAVAKTRYQAIMGSQPYTLTITAPANTYVVTNVTTTVASAPVPLPGQNVALNGGAGATYTFTFCPNGTVYGAGGVCPGANAPPALSVSSQGRQVNVNVTSVGNVTTKSIK